LAIKSEAALARRREYMREYDRRRRAEGKKVRPPLTEEQKAKRREAGRRYKEKNREKRLEQARQYKKDHAEETREYKRMYRQRMKETNPEKLREQDRAHYQRQVSKPGYKKKRTEAAQKSRWGNPAYREMQRAAHKKFTHGPGFAEAWAVMWNEQDGKCYLCREPLIEGRTTHVDHDHSCCPKGKTCSLCRRGLACERCNHVIGEVADSPELLRLIADNLEPVLARTHARLATKPEQPELWEEAS
jgi:Recombination endonuclease VII